MGWSEWVESGGEALPMGKPSKKKKGARPKAKGKSKAKASRPTADDVNPIVDASVLYDRGTVDPWDVGAQVGDFIDDNLASCLAKKTNNTYTRNWDRWACYARVRGLPSPYLRTDTPSEERTAEREVLTFAGYLGWIGKSHAVVTSHILSLIHI